MLEQSSVRNLRSQMALGCLKMQFSKTIHRRLDTEFLHCSSKKNGPLKSSDCPRHPTFSLKKDLQDLKNLKPQQLLVSANRLVARAIFIWGPGATLVGHAIPIQGPFRKRMNQSLERATARINTRCRDKH